MYNFALILSSLYIERYVDDVGHISLINSFIDLSLRLDFGDEV